jgi:hypothetical protein
MDEIYIPDYDTVVMAAGVLDNNQQGGVHAPTISTILGSKSQLFFPFLGS